MEQDAKGESMNYTRFYADASGESHMDDMEAAFAPRDFAPPAPPLDLSPIVPATGAAFLRFPAGWTGICTVHETIKKVYMIR